MVDRFLFESWWRLGESIPFGWITRDLSNQVWFSIYSSIGRDDDATSPWLLFPSSFLFYSVHTHTQKSFFIFTFAKKKKLFFTPLSNWSVCVVFEGIKKKRNLSLRFLHPMRRGGQCWMPFTHTKKKKREKRFCARNLITKVWHDPRYLYINRIVFFSLPTEFFFFLCFVVRFDSRQGIHNRPPSTTSPPLYNFVVLQLSKRRIYRRAAASFPSYIISSSYTSQKIGMRKKKNSCVYII